MKDPHTMFSLSKIHYGLSSKYHYGLSNTRLNLGVNKPRSQLTKKLMVAGSDGLRLGDTANVIVIIWLFMFDSHPN